MNDDYKVDRHFGARGWLTTLWMDWRRRSGCAIPCECVTCSIYTGAIKKWDEVVK